MYDRDIIVETSQKEQPTIKSNITDKQGREKEGTASTGEATDGDSAREQEARNRTSNPGSQSAEAYQESMSTKAGTYDGSPRATKPRTNQFRKGDGESLLGVSGTRRQRKPRTIFYKRHSRQELLGLLIDMHQSVSGSVITFFRCLCCWPLREIPLRYPCSPSCLGL